MSLAIHQVDAFADRPFVGNPAAVCILPEPRADDWMKNVAMEMNQAETAFLVPSADGFQLRWFTPTMEVDLCGHATLASAHVLWETGRVAIGERIRFHTRSGLLTAVRTDLGIEMDFPATPATATEVPAALTRALGIDPLFSGKNQFDHLFEIEDEAQLRNLQPDFNLVKTTSMRGVIVTARSVAPDFDFVSRFFAPAAGINEDPVTGSAHCTLGPYWRERLGKSELQAYQASRRGGTVGVRVQDDRVTLIGHAVTVFRAELL
jgi:PhzF family phenazine biosynthesis protein